MKQKIKRTRCDNKECGLNPCHPDTKEGCNYYYVKDKKGDTMKEKFVRFMCKKCEQEFFEKPTEHGIFTSVYTNKPAKREICDGEIVELGK